LNARPVREISVLARSPHGARALRFDHSAFATFACSLFFRPARPRSTRSVSVRARCLSHRSGLRHTRLASVCTPMVTSLLHLAMISSLPYRVAAFAHHARAVARCSPCGAHFAAFARGRRASSCDDHLRLRARAARRASSCDDHLRVPRCATVTTCFTLR